jgi:hypothetical protein
MAPALPPEAWAQIRHDYEHTERPVAAICAEYRISTGTLRDRMHRWNWTRRRPPIAREAPLATAMPGDPFALPPLEKGRSPAEGGRVGIEGPNLAGVDPLPIPPLFEGREEPVAPLVTDPASIVPRLQSAVARVLPAIEATLARLAGGPQRPREMEQAARALNTMMRTLRELNALLREQQARAAREGEDDDLPEGMDIDMLREALAQRIEAFMEARGDEDFSADEPPTAAPAGR